MEKPFESRFEAIDKRFEPIENRSNPLRVRSPDRLFFVTLIVAIPAFFSLEGARSVLRKPEGPRRSRNWVCMPFSAARRSVRLQVKTERIVRF
jgi:hypothetical protein